uniref:family 1 glycosylhydrolase n=1 Tax=Proteus faecis TaxID=2050967 RepID=UPI003075C16B
AYAFKGSNPFLPIFPACPSSVRIEHKNKDGVMNFGKNFVWGAAAAAFQIEGAAHEEGKGLSIWDMLCATPGKIWQGHTGEIACDHYHRYKE